MECILAVTLVCQLEADDGRESTIYAVAVRLVNTWICTGLPLVMCSIASRSTPHIQLVVYDCNVSLQDATLRGQ